MARAMIPVANLL